MLGGVQLLKVSWAMAGAFLSNGLPLFTPFCTEDGSSFGIPADRPRAVRAKLLERFGKLSARGWFAKTGRQNLDRVPKLTPHQSKHEVTLQAAVSHYTYPNTKLDNTE